MPPTDNRCLARSHDWGTTGPHPGAVCVRPGCGKVFGTRPRRRRYDYSSAMSATNRPAGPDSHLTLQAAYSSPAAPSPSLSQNSALAARWGVAPPPAAVSPPPATEADSEQSEIGGQKLAEMLTPFFADGTIAIERWIIDWRGRVPNDADDEQRQELHKCTEVLLRKMLPDVAVGAWQKWGFCVLVLYAQMRIGAEKKPKIEAIDPKKMERPADSSGGAVGIAAASNVISIRPSSPPSASCAPSDDSGVESAPVKSSDTPRTDSATDAT